MKKATAHRHSAEANLHASKSQTSSFSCLLNDRRTKLIAPISSGGRPMPAQQLVGNNLSEVCMDEEKSANSCRTNP
jgi:hypothetical protein